MRLMCDPPNGWMYGFPKVVSKDNRHKILDWLVEQGYPKEEITKMGKNFYCRFWEIEGDEV